MSIGSTSAPDAGITLNISGVTTISDSTNSTAITNGALVVSGGVGIANALRVGGILDVTGTTNHFIRNRNLSECHRTYAVPIDKRLSV